MIRQRKKVMGTKILLVSLLAAMIVLSVTFFFAADAASTSFTGYDIVSAAMKYLDDSKYQYKNVAVEVPADPTHGIYDCSSFVTQVIADVMGVGYWESGLPTYSGGWRDTYFSGKSVGDVVTVGGQKFVITVMPGTSYTAADLPAGTIMIYASNGRTYHMAISLGEHSASNVKSDVYSTYCGGATGLSDSELNRLLNATCNNGVAKISLSNYNNTIWRIHAPSAARDICIDNGNTGGTSGQAVLSYAMHPVESSNSGQNSNASPTTTAAPTVQRAEVTNQTENSYTVTVTFDAPAGVSEVYIPTWTMNNGQDDLVWHKASVSGNTATYTVKTSSHNNELGTYLTHIYVYDRNGRYGFSNVTVQLSKAVASAPTITDVQVSDVTQDGYRVTATFQAPAGVREVLMPTWTQNNGQDDVVWHVATVSGNTATYYVKTNGHKGETGTYITHIYVYDSNNKYALTGTSVNVPAAKSSASPTITNIQVTEQSSSGYRVTVSFNAPAGLREVLMPTWTQRNGQDDIVWYRAQVSGNTATCYIASSEHNKESGTYTTHIYVMDVNGQYALEGRNVSVSGSSAAPVIKSVQVSEQSSQGYRVTVSFEAAAGVKHVYFPTWTQKNGQDDIIWHEAKASGNTASFYIKRSDHKSEFGAYTTHVYVYDKNGAFALHGVDVNVQ